jgi:hypothetical protein
MSTTDVPGHSFMDRYYSRNAGGARLVESFKPVSLSATTGKSASISAA